MIKKILAFLIILVLILSLSSCGESSEPIEVVCDITKYANLTSSELVELLGKPDNIENTTPSNGFVEIPCAYYEYNSTDELGEVSFVLINDSVAQLISYKEFPSAKDEKIMSAFNITLSDNCAVVEESDTTLRYRCPSEEVDDFWASNINKDTGTFDFLKVTFDLLYFEEWYMPMSISEQSDYQYYTQKNVEAILKVPKTAEFPNINSWAFGKNYFYTGVQSYVDAENSFGAKIRNEFNFIYKTGTDEIVYAIFNGEVIVDNGYVSTAKLIKEIVSPPSKEVKEKKEQTKIEETKTSSDKQTDAKKTETNNIKLVTTDMNEFLVHYILPQYVDVQGVLQNYTEYDSSENTDWCYKIVGEVGNSSYEAMVYPFTDAKNNIQDLWCKYIYWNGELICENAIGELINYSPKKY